MKANASSTLGMFSFIKVFFSGLLISFLGQLPLANSNVLATQITVEEGFKNAWKFGLGIAIVEIIYLRIALTSMKWVIAHKIIFTILGWATVVIFLVLGVVSFIAAYKQRNEEKKAVLLETKLDRFLLGASLCAINPVQIPFWFTWSLYLINNKVLQPTNAAYNFFIVGAGLGTLAGIAVYIHGGNWIIRKMKAKKKSLNEFTGGVFIVIALIQLYKLIFTSPLGKAK